MMSTRSQHEEVPEIPTWAVVLLGLLLIALVALAIWAELTAEPSGTWPPIAID